MHTAIHHSPHLQEYPQKKMQYHSLVLIAYVLALLCPLLCVGYLSAVDPDVVIYEAVNVTRNYSCIYEGVCDNGAALCAQGNEVVLGSECDPTGFWTALLLLKWVYIFVWLTRLPFLFTSVMHVAGKEGTLPDTLVDNCTVVSQLASLATFVITVGAFWERNKEGTYFPTGFPYMLWYVMQLDFGMSMLLPLPSCKLSFPCMMLLILSCVTTQISAARYVDMPFYLPFVIFMAATSAWLMKSFAFRGFLELLTVCSFFVYTASYYALDVEDREDTTYFTYGHSVFQMMAPIHLFLIAVSTAFITHQSKPICKPITWEGVCAMPHQQAAAVTNVLGAIDAGIAARRREKGKDSRTPESLPQDTLHTAFHGATTAEMSKIVEYFCETRNGFSIIVASRVLIDRNDLLVVISELSASLKYRLLKACDDKALSTHVLQTIPIASLFEAINDVERNPEEALDYVAKFVCVEKLVPECTAVPSWRYMLPFVARSAPTPACALLARGYKGLLPKRRLYIAAAVMWVCVYLAGLVFSIYVCATLGLEEDTDGSMPLFLVFLVPAGVLVSYDVVSPPIRHALCVRLTKRVANNSLIMKMNAPDETTSTQSTDSAKVEKPQSADDGADVTVQLEEVDVEGADDV